MEQEIFLKKIKLNGCPYVAAEKYRIEGVPEREVWLTDDRESLRRLLSCGECVLYLLTAQNRDIPCPEAGWCVEMPEDSVLSDQLSMDFLWRVWLRSQGLPWQICETKRLYLREMTEEDLDFLYHCQQDADTARFIEGPEGDREEELEKIEAYRRLIYGFYGFGLWIVCDKKNGKPVGRAGLQIREDAENVELGFEIEVSQRGKRYAREALEAVIVYAKEELEQDALQAVVDVENTASRRLCESLGFTERERKKQDGKNWIFYSLLI